MKVLLSMDDRLVQKVDAEARARGVTRSRFLSMLAERELGLFRGPGKTPAVRAALSDIDELFAAARAREATRAVREAREQR